MSELTPRQQFKFGFLLRCADEGLDSVETKGRIKLAEGLLEKQAINPFRAAVDAAKNIGWGGLALAGAGGLGAGYGLGKLTSDNVDPEEVKKQELIAAYKQQVDRIRRNSKTRSYRGQSGAPRAPSLM